LNIGREVGNVNAKKCVDYFLNLFWGRELAPVYERLFWLGSRGLMWFNVGHAYTSIPERSRPRRSQLKYYWV